LLGRLRRIVLHGSEQPAIDRIELHIVNLPPCFSSTPDSGVPPRFFAELPRHLSLSVAAIMTRARAVAKCTTVCCCLAGVLPGMSATAAPEEPSSRERAVAIDTVPMISDEAVDLERLARGLKRPWSLAFTPDGELPITEKYAGVRVMRDGVVLPEVLPGGPAQVLAKADSGLLDVALDPDFETSRLVFIAFAEGTEEANRTAVWKARYDGSRLVDGQVIVRVRPDKAGTGHPGGRLLFLPDRTFLFTVGDGYDYKSAAQDPGSHLGKTLRLTREGRAPNDNVHRACRVSPGNLEPRASQRAGHGARPRHRRDLAARARPARRRRAQPAAPRRELWLAGRHPWHRL
jgi:glucose/arabinose dehydrogenase